MNNVGDLVSVVGKAVGERTDVADLTLGVVPSWPSLTSYTPLIILQCLFRML